MNRENPPLVSVIIPVYNVEKYLSECVDSVLSQIYANLEIILIDDGSPDNCGRICDKYANKDSSIKVIHKKNGGLSDARNAGLDVCTGEYITFVDSDDILSKYYVELLLTSIEENQCDYAYCDHILFENTDCPFCSDDKQRKNKNVRLFFQEEMFREINNPYDFRSVVIWNKLFQRNLFNSFRFKKGVLHEDEYAIHHLVYESKKIVFLDTPLYAYRQREGSIVNSQLSEERFSHFEKAMADRINFFKQKGISKILYVKQRLWYYYKFAYAHYTYRPAKMKILANPFCFILYYPSGIFSNIKQWLSLLLGKR